MHAGRVPKRYLWSVRRYFGLQASGQGVAFVPGAIDEGACCHILLSALVAQEEAVESVDGYGSHRFSVLIDSASSRAIV